MSEENQIFLEDDLPFEEKDKFWDLIYKKVSRAVRRKHSFTIIFHLDEMGLENDDGYSIIIEKKDYMTFLRNFLLWSEQLERYELCSEAQNLIQELEQWEKSTD